MADFPLLFGNIQTKNRLKSAIRSGNLPHAILIVGKDGSGRRTMAREIARAMLCSERANEHSALPCGICSSCLRIPNDNHPDVNYLVRDEKKATIGVEEVRALRDDMFLSATESEYKFYIIEEAERMTKGAQNALLKVLEEPPKAVNIILLADSEDKLLSTIRSRTQLIRTEVFGAEDIISYLKASNILPNEASYDKLDLAARFADGRIGNALINLNDGTAEENRERARIVLEFTSALSSRTPFSVLYSAANAFPQKRENLRAALEKSLDAIRDLIAVRCSEDCPLCFFTTRDDALSTLGAMQTKRLVDISKIILSAIDSLDKNVPSATILTDMCVRIKQS